MATRIVRWNPIRELAELQTALNRPVRTTQRAQVTTLPVNVIETTEAYSISADLPGVNPDDIEISLHDDVLTIRAEIPAASIEDGSRTLIRERFSGQLERRFRLQKPVAEDAIEASYEAGVLRLLLPKSPEAQPRQIPVRTANVIRSEN